MVSLTDLELEVVLDGGERHVVFCGQTWQFDEANLAEERVQLGAHVLGHLHDGEAGLRGGKRCQLHAGLMRSNQRLVDV